MSLTLTNSAHDPNQIDAKSTAHRDMYTAWWRLTHDLLGGTKTMRDRGEVWLPKEPGETNAAYTVRIERSFLYEALASTIDELVSKPFSKEVTINGEMPEKLAAIQDDVDFTGTDLTTFLADVFEDGLQHGLSHILIDAPSTGGRLNMQEESVRGIRPTFVHVKAPDLLGYRTGIGPTGTIVLTQVRILETRLESDGKFGDTEVQYVRIINAPETAYIQHDSEPQPFDGTPGTWELWRKDPGAAGVADSSAWKQHTKPTAHSFAQIPLVTFYVDRIAHQKARPPLMALAWLNLRHWHTSSDQTNILRYARIPMIHMSGMTAEERDEPQTISVARIHKSVNPESKMTWVEHSGLAIKAGEDDIRALEERMEILGLSPLVERTQNSTAFGKASNDTKKHSGIQAWIRRLEMAALHAYRIAAEMISVTIPDDVSVDVFNDFAITLHGGTDSEFLLKMRQARELSRETFLRETKRRGILAETTDVADEITAIEDEGPDPMTVGLSGITSTGDKSKPPVVPTGD